jgi:hypothetical protein
LLAPQVFIEQHNRRRKSGYVTPGRQEQRPLKRKGAAVILALERVVNFKWVFHSVL